MAKYKRCVRCKETKSTDQFRRGNNSDGLHSWCHDCNREYERGRRRTAPKYNVDSTVLEKCCSRCKEIKPADQFNRDRKNKDGLQAWCKPCWTEHRASVDHDVDPTVREKLCSRCKEVKPVGRFSSYRTAKDGLCSWCKDCVNEHGRERSGKLNYDVDPTLREKHCSRCKEIKPVDQFDRQRRSRDGLQHRCKSCMKEVNAAYYLQNKDKFKAYRQAWVEKNPERAREIGRKRHLKKEYDLTLEEFDLLLVAQDGKCALCGEPFNGVTPHVDHDHSTGRVRGLLCGPCNKTLGFAQECPKRLLAAAEFLRRQGFAVEDFVLTSAEARRLNDEWAARWS